MNMMMMMNMMIDDDDDGDEYDDDDDDELTAHNLITYYRVPSSCSCFTVASFWKRFVYLHLKHIYTL